MPLRIPNTTVPDDYSDTAAKFAGTDIFSQGYVIVSNNAVFARYFSGEHGQAHPSDEIFCPPSIVSIQSGSRDPIAGIQFRNAVAGSPAQILGVIYYPGEAMVQAGSSFDGTISAGGGFTPPSGITYGGKPASPKDGDLWIYSGNGWFFRYTTNLNQWQLIGGDPFLTQLDAAANSSAASNVWDNTVGPQALIPYTGSYKISMGGEPATAAAAVTSDLGFSKNGADPVNGELAWFRTNNTTRGGLWLESSALTTAFAENDTVTLAIRDSDSLNRIAWSKRTIGILPIVLDT